MTPYLGIKCEVCGDTPVRCFCDAHVPSQGGSSDLRQAVAKMREIADFNYDNRFGRLALEAIADLEASCSPPESAPSLDQWKELVSLLDADARQELMRHMAALSREEQHGPI
jgi:hypothetical protein